MIMILDTTYQTELNGQRKTIVYANPRKLYDLINTGCTGENAIYKDIQFITMTVTLPVDNSFDYERKAIVTFSKSDYNILMRIGGIKEVVETLTDFAIQTEHDLSVGNNVLWSEIYRTDDKRFIVA